VSVIGLDDGRVRERGRRLGKGGVFFYLAREKGGVCVPIPTHSSKEKIYLTSTSPPTMKPSILPPEFSKTVYFTLGRFLTTVLQ